MTEPDPHPCPGLESLEQFCRNGTPADVADHVLRCPQCSEPKRPHRVCANCGTYRGREVVQTEEE